MFEGGASWSHLGQVGELVPELSWNLKRGGEAAGLTEMAPVAGGKDEVQEVGTRAKWGMNTLLIQRHRGSEKVIFVYAYLFFPESYGSWKWKKH